MLTRFKKSSSFDLSLRTNRAPPTRRPFLRSKERRYPVTTHSKTTAREAMLQTFNRRTEPLRPSIPRVSLRTTARSLRTRVTKSLLSGHLCISLKRRSKLVRTPKMRVAKATSALQLTVKSQQQNRSRATTRRSLTTASLSFPSRQKLGSVRRTPTKSTKTRTLCFPISASTDEHTFLQSQMVMVFLAKKFLNS